MGDLITVKWICTSEQSRVVCSFCLLTIDGFATLDVEDVVCNSLSIKTFFSRGWGWSGMGSGIGYVDQAHLKLKRSASQSVRTEGVYHYTWPNTIHARQMSYQRLMIRTVYGIFLK